MNHRVSRFVLVGAFNTFVDFSILNLLVFTFGLNKLPANIISTMTAMSISYVLNHGFVFKDERNKSSKQFALFLLITAFGLLVIQNLVIYLMVHFITLPAEIIYKILNVLFEGIFTKDFIYLNTAKATATILTMVWNYEMYKHFVFKKESNSTDLNSHS